MGLFSSSYETTVGTSASRVVEDQLIVSSLKQGTIAGLFDSTQSNQLVEYILEAVSTGLGARTESMYDYAKKSYTWGLPTSQLFTTATGESVVWSVLKNLVSPLIKQEYYHFGVINYLHVGWFTLVKNYNYNSVTNELPALTASHAGCLTYLKDMVVVVRESAADTINPGCLEQWGISPSAGFTPYRTASSSILQGAIANSLVRIDPTATSEHILVTYVWQTSVTVLEGKIVTIVDGKEVVISPGTWVTTLTKHEDSLQIPITGYDNNADYFHARYSFNGVDSYWLYKLATGTYPEIDSIFSVDHNDSGSFFPIAYFKQGVLMDSDLDSDIYKTSTKMLNYLGMDYQQVIDAIKENPGIGDVEQAMLTFGIPPDTVEPVEQQYLFDFFTKLYLASGGISVDPGWDLGTISPEQDSDNHGLSTTPEEEAIKTLLGLTENPKISLLVQDRLLKTSLSCHSIFKKSKAGTVAAVDKYCSSFTTEDITYPYTKVEYVQDANGETKEVLTQYTVTQPLDLYTYCHQITDSVYEEIKVYDLQLKYLMWGGFSTLGDDKDTILLVPVDHTISSTYATVDRELLYTRSMHYVFNSRIVTEVKWYQQSWFQFVMIIVAVVLTIISIPPEFLMQLIAFNVGTMTLTAFLIAVAQGFVIPYILAALAVKLFVKVAGVKLAFLAAIVLMAWTGYNNFTNSVAGAPWADTLLSMSNGLTAEVNTAIKGEMDSLIEDVNNFNLYVEDKTAELESVNDLLYTNILLSPQWFVGQTPDELYNTVHYGNIGMAGVDCVASFVDIALTLPNINNTLGTQNG